MESENESEAIQLKCTTISLTRPHPARRYLAVKADNTISEMFLIGLRIKSLNRFRSNYDLKGNSWDSQQFELPT